MNALWRPVPGFPAYEISPRGQVRSVDTRYVLTPRHGVVALSRDGKAHRCVVRDLVAAAWPKEPAASAEPFAQVQAEPLLRVAEALDATFPEDQQPPPRRHAGRHVRPSPGRARGVGRARPGR